MILGASTVGGEYGWGTLRTALTKGTGRWQFLGAKSLSLVLFSVAGLLVVSLTVVVSSLIAASLTLGDGGGLVGAGQWSTVAVMFGKATYVLVAYAILALFLTVLTSSSSMGVATSLAYYFAEFLLGRILGDLFAWFDNVSDFLIGFNTAAWMTETGVVTTEGPCSPSVTLLVSCTPFLSCWPTSSGWARRRSGSSNAGMWQERGANDSSVGAADSLGVPLCF